MYRSSTLLNLTSIPSTSTFRSWDRPDIGIFWSFVASSTGKSMYIGDSLHIFVTHPALTGELSESAWRTQPAGKGSYKFLKVQQSVGDTLFNLLTVHLISSFSWLRISLVPRSSGTSCLMFNRIFSIGFKCKSLVPALTRSRNFTSSCRMYKSSSSSGSACGMMTKTGSKHKGGIL
ncbi:hypothetical protein P280DRAFT_214437 [Massarina eburnea CBS 473.64]|uniref:Uncharacterized protein n=1 Tax=Massarina eburnea CBS 473.64 TaxID=1395130 RepID=A0A6A6S7M2_9PLEO|nr:hypothetical protein P280DRAFT_214437 [Massarina eburnea CBS 473.64]